MIEYLVVGVPKDIVPRETSETLSKFERVTGIKKTRRYINSTSSMICDTLDSCNRENFIGVNQLIVITQSPDQLSPCMATEIHNYLELSPEIIAFDINHACDGWVLGVNLANKLGGKTLLICADQLRYGSTQPESLIFSDAVSITVIRAGFDDFHSYTDGSMAGQLHCGLNGEMRMNGDAVFDFVTTKVPELIKKFPDEDYMVPHQANLSMNRLLEIRSGYKERTLYSIEEFGNQSMNSIPTCLAYNESKIVNKSVLCVGFGAGFTAAGIGLFWNPKTPSKIVEI